MTNTVEAADITLPTSINIFNAVGNFFERIKLLPSRLNEEKLMAKAMKKTNLSDFGDDRFREGLSVFFDALAEEGRLSLSGRVAVTEFVTNLLVNRLRMVELLKTHPEIEQQPIEKPIFIVGLARTGSTILQNLLAQDPLNRTPLTWETDCLCPPLDGPDTRIQDAQKKRDDLCRMIPGFQAIHPVGANLPEECDTLMAYNFESPRFLMYPAPNYEPWYRKRDLTATYKFHKQCLQLLNYFNPGQRWLLKQPAHSRSLDTLLEVYPDARIIQTHRDPKEVVTSFFALGDAMSKLLKKQRKDEKADENYAKQVIALTEEDLDASIRTRSQMPDKADQFYDLHFSDFMADQIGSIKAIYQYFDMELSDEAEAAMRKYLEDNGQRKHGTHVYSPETYGMTETQLESSFTHYCSHFGVKRA